MIHYINLADNAQYIYLEILQGQIHQGQDHNPTQEIKLVLVCMVVA